MKKETYKILSAAFLILLAAGCSDDVDYTDARVSPVPALNFPAEDYFVQLQSGTGKQVEFSWAGASAEDGMGVQYELVFYDRATGGTEIGLIDVGMTPKVIVTHKELNKISGNVGIGSGETGVLYWSVRASRGPISAMYEGPARTLNIRRLVGFDDIPANLYITGAASETGEELSEARQFVPVSAVGDEGEFEIYTEIGHGTFNLVSSREPSHRTFGFLNDLLEETEEGITVEPGIYRIEVDFTVKTLTFVQINTVSYVYMQLDEHTPMEYAGGGVWRLVDFTLEFDRPGWGTRGFEERYRFEVSTVDGTEVWGPYDTGLDGAPGELNFNSDYFTVVARAYTDFWDPKWKWYQSAVPDSDEAAGPSNPFKHVDLFVDMSGETARYYHHYTVL